MKRLISAAMLAIGTAAGAAHAGSACTLLADAATRTILIEEGDCARRTTPASTFKIAISLMGFDSGVLKSAHGPVMRFQPGYADWRPEWKEDTDPARWMKLSVVWYSQQVTTLLGKERFRHYVDAFNYGNRDVSSGLTKAWLSASLAISPREQLDFVERVVRHELPVNLRAYSLTEQITELDPLPGGWRLHGKTGTGTNDGEAVGWFVGWVEKDGRSIVFVRRVLESEDKPGPAGLRARDAFLRTLPGMLNTLQAR
ncbi:MAG TPA: class D beta-lactamase [Telluria sp.]|nr:class D beta-lactamase [Telluria sp.]